MKDIKIDYEGGSIVLHPSFFPASMPDLRSVLRMADAAGIPDEFHAWTEECCDALPEVYKKGAEAARAQAWRLKAEASDLRKEAEAVRKQEKDEEGAAALLLHTKYMRLRAQMEWKLEEAHDYRLKASGMDKSIKRLQRNREEVETWQNLPQRML